MDSLSSPPPRIATWKRPLDLAILIVLAPAILILFSFLALFIKLVSRGPVFFIQERIGYREKPFRMLKFRSMRVNADSGMHERHLASLIKSSQPLRKLDSQGDQRLIPGGWLLRASGLDELPQLINVLKGEMSIVGPRPCTRYEFDLFEPWHKDRCHALPGLTGLWQVSGKNTTTFEEMIKLDIHYAFHQSLRLDFMILLRTIPALTGQVGDHVRKVRPPSFQLSTASSRAGTRR